MASPSRPRPPAGRPGPMPCPALSACAPPAGRPGAEPCPLDLGASADGRPGPPPCPAPSVCAPPAGRPGPVPRPALPDRARLPGGPGRPARLPKSGAGAAAPPASALQHFRPGPGKSSRQARSAPQFCERDRLWYSIISRSPRRPSGRPDVGTEAPAAGSRSLRNPVPREGRPARAGRGRVFSGPPSRPLRALRSLVRLPRPERAAPWAPFRPCRHRATRRPSGPAATAPPGAPPAPPPPRRPSGPAPPSRPPRHPEHSRHPGPADDHLKRHP
jgi:hypothetical protein